MNVPVVPISSLVCMLLSVVLGVGFPVALAILWHKKTKAHVVSLVIGALTFLVFVYVLENALHQLCIYTDNGISRFLSSHMWAYILYGGLAAGVFEETGRLLAFRFLLKKQTGKETSVMYGIGHGGIEALLICGYSMLSLFIFSLQLNASGTEALLALGGDNAANVQQTIDAVTKNSWGMFLLSGVERIIAVCLHISLSVFVFLSARRSGKWYLYPVAILIHAVVDCTALFFNVSGLISNMWVLELIVAAMTAVVAYFAFRLYRRDAVISREENADAAAAQVQDGEMSDR